MGKAHGHLIGADRVDARAVGLEQSQRHRLRRRIDAVTAGVESEAALDVDILRSIGEERNPATLVLVRVPRCFHLSFF